MRNMMKAQAAALTIAACLATPAQAADAVRPIVIQPGYIVALPNGSVYACKTSSLREAPGPEWLALDCQDLTGRQWKHCSGQFITGEIACED